VRIAKRVVAGGPSGGRRAFGSAIPFRVDARGSSRKRGMAKWASIEDHHRCVSRGKQAVWGFGWCHIKQGGDDDDDDPGARVVRHQASVIFPLAAPPAVLALQPMAAMLLLRRRRRSRTRGAQGRCAHLRV